MTSYIDTVICIEPNRILETWPPIYRGQEKPARARLRLSQLSTTLILNTHQTSPCLTDLYLRAHPTPFSPDPKSFIEDICRVNPCQLAPTVKRHIATKVHTNLCHRAITIVLDTGAAVDDLGHHRQNTTKAQGTEEPEDLGLPARHTIMKTVKKRWEHHALLTEFAPHLFPKDSNCPMISRNMMGLRSHSHGSQIIYKHSKY
jgi:hypothetical protein